MASEAAGEVRLEPDTTKASGIRSPFVSGGRIRAVLFDLDGTLYRQAPMRVLMALELMTLALTNPFLAPRRWRGLREYRRAQEQLRGKRAASQAAFSNQLDVAAERSGLSRAALEQLVDEWMFTRPLKYMPLCRVPGLIELLDLLDRQGLGVGVLSDYPAAAKLRALGLTNRFPLVLCSTDPDIGALKPDPRGFLVACSRWDLPPKDVLMVGDRMDVDAAGAAAAGMPCVIIGKQSSSTLVSAGALTLPSLERLRSVLDDGC